MDDLTQATRLLQILRAWYWNGAGVFDPARADPLYPEPNTIRNRSAMWEEVCEFLKDRPYRKPPQDSATSNVSTTGD